MGKIIKRLLIFLVIAALVAGGIYGGLTYYKKSQTMAVNVYPVRDVVMPSEYFMDDSKAYGSITADRIQSVFISGTQNVKEVLVKEGQKVKKGDPLMSYDTTLTQIQLEKAENELAQQELILKRSEKELEMIKRLTPSSEDEFEDDGGDVGDIEEPEPTPEPTEAPVQYSPEETAIRLSGKGTLQDPYIYLWSSDDALTTRQLLAMFTESGVAPEVRYATPEGEEVVEGGEIYEEVDEPADTPEEEGVETAQEAFIFRRLGLIPFTVYGDEVEEGVEEGVEYGGDEIITGDEIISGYDDETLLPEESGEPVIEFAAEDDEVLMDPSYADPTWTEDPGEAGDDDDGGEEDIESGEEISPEIISEETLLPDENQGIPIPVIAGSVGAVEDTSWLSGAPNEVYVILEMHESNNSKAPILLRFGLHLIRDGAEVAVRLFSPDAAQENTSNDEGDDITDVTEIDADDEGDAEDIEDIDDVDLPGGGLISIDDDEGDIDDEDIEEATAPSLSEPGIDMNAHYTVKEIEELRSEKEKEVRDETISYKLAVINLKEMKAEMADGQVRSKLDGVVKTVRDPDAAYTNSEAVVVVSGGGGYMVNIGISELELDSVAVEQEVEVSNFNNESDTYRGLVKTVSDYPMSGGGDGWSMGNPNVSYYPCTVSIIDDAEFREGDYVGVKYKNNNKDSRAFYVESMFILSDSTGRYAYVKGEDGKLTRRNVVTGKSPDSYVVEIRGGLSPDDMLAFPYGTNVEEGAVTEDATIDALYG